MDHLFHIFIPGTPENTGLMSLLPALAPFQFQLWLLAWRGSVGLLSFRRLLVERVNPPMEATLQ